ncbi:LOW QUALITY PROTEIN: Hypothetical protein PHPALM_37159 [Phytophthora palmivora]|uniref:DUF659 domain-containing protein n=1 Tax=Phytophthora palmivora TaxID=4796 RepID=A0A2P4WY60_9STRA|nr:LOW QUALITY PROTEIN: Hypothetical protein PHPALM_37159 [Phytophthora palmivora]
MGSSGSCTKTQQKSISDFLSVEEQSRFERDLPEFQSECALPDSFVECTSSKRLLAVKFELLRIGSSHHIIALARLMQSSIIRALELVWNVGGVITDNAGQCARARRILALRWPNIFLRCFAHDVNNLVKAVLQTGLKTDTKQAASATAVLNSSSRAAKRTMQVCFANLLRVRTALEDFPHEFRNNPEFPSSLTLTVILQNLVVAERVIQPLSETSFRLQKNGKTMADVVRCFEKNHSAFAACPYASYPAPVVEKR